MVPPFYIKLVGSAVTWGLDWTGMSKKAHSHDWMLRRAICRGLSSLSLASLHGQVSLLMCCLHSERRCPMNESFKKKEVEAISFLMF